MTFLSACTLTACLQMYRGLISLVAVGCATAFEASSGAQGNAPIFVALLSDLN